MSEYSIHPTATVENVNRDTWRHREVDGPFVTTSARALSNNMSEAYNQFGEDLTKEEKSERAKANMQQFHEAINIPIDDVFVMKPQIDYSEPLGVIYVDDVFQPGHGGDHATVSEQRGDMLVTFNADVALECRPADCPVVSGQVELEDGRTAYVQVHLGWNGLNAGYMTDFIHEIHSLNPKIDTLKLQMSGAGYAESFHYENAENPLDDESHALDKDGNPMPKRFSHERRQDLFVNVEATEKMNEHGQPIYGFDMDMPGFIRKELERAGIDAYQLYEEGSDTTSAESGYSSHRRDGSNKTANTRDVVVLRGKGPEQMISADRAEAMLARHALQVVEAQQQ